MEPEELIKHIAATLNEPNLPLVRKVIKVLGPERTEACLQKALEIEASGGMMTKDGSRRRTPGGVFFQVVRESATSKERRRIFPRMVTTENTADKEQKQTGRQGDRETVVNPAHPSEQSTVSLSPDISLSSLSSRFLSAVKPPTWEEAKQLIVQAYKSIAEGKTVKLTLIGRPTQVTKQATCVVMAIKGKPPGSFPKGLPEPPAQSAITWAVFVAMKQWDKVKHSLEANAEDELIIEGYPMVDPKRGVGVVLATNCSSKLMQRAEREAKQSKG
jgi:hypothetical protein